VLCNHKVCYITYTDTTDRSSMHCPPLYPPSAVVVISPTYVPIFIYNHLANLSKQMLAVITLSGARMTCNLDWMRGQTGKVSSTIIPTNHATAVSSHSSNLPADTNTYHTRQQMIVCTGSARGTNIQNSHKTIWCYNLRK